MTRGPVPSIESFPGMKHALRAALLLLVCVALTGADAAPPLATLVLCPPSDEQFRELFAHPDQWARLRAKTAALLYADHALGKFTDQELRTWFAALVGWVSEA